MVLTAMTSLLLFVEFSDPEPSLRSANVICDYFTNGTNSFSLECLASKVMLTGDSPAGLGSEYTGRVTLCLLSSLCCKPCTELLNPYHNRVFLYDASSPSSAFESGFDGLICCLLISCHLECPFSPAFPGCSYHIGCFLLVRRCCLWCCSVIHLVAGSVLENQWVRGHSIQPTLQPAS